MRRRVNSGRAKPAAPQLDAAAITALFDQWADDGDAMGMEGCVPSHPPGAASHGRSRASCV